MKNYETLKDAIDDLKNRGYTADFDMKQDSAGSLLRIHPDDFNVDEYYRFEGQTDPDDSSVIYAISSAQGIKGILIDAYGAYAENMTPEIAEKLKVHLKQ